MSRLRLDASDLARIAVFAAIVAVLGLPGGLSVLGGVPITAQTLGVMLAGAILGPWRGALSMVAFLLLVALGLPLLSGGRGGAGVFAGASAGYLVGWIAGAFVIGLIVHAGGRRLTWPRTAVGMLVGGILAVYALGIPVQAFVTRIPLAQTAQLSAVFLPGDLVKAAIATAITMTLVRAYPRAFRRSAPEVSSGPAVVPASVAVPTKPDGGAATADAEVPPVTDRSANPVDGTRAP